MARVTAITATLLCLAVAGCKPTARTRAKSPRIVTFAPHITQIAYDMGLGEHIVGVSTFCVVATDPHPPALGNALKINSEAISLQEPDILFYNTKDSDYDGLRRLMPALRLVRVRNATLGELREGIRAMGDAAGRGDLAAALLQRVDGELAAIAEAVAGRGRPRVLVVLGTQHPLTVGAGSMMHELIEVAGGVNVAAEADLGRWSRINLETVVSLDPEVLICLSDAGADNVRAAREYWADKTAVKAVRDGRLYVIGDRRLTIQGSRVGWIARMLAEKIHPDAPALGAPEKGTGP